MSHPLVSHSPDLTRLAEEGYAIEIRDANLLVKHVPFVTAQRNIDYGILVSELSTNGMSTITPRTHEVWFVGSLPCDNHGREIPNLINQRTATNFGSGLVAERSFSSKPLSGAYRNYYDKMTSYVRILSSYARAIQPAVTARIYPLEEPGGDESVFHYLDTASSRAGISAISAKLKLDRLAIIGLGGTGSYILDLVAKTPVGEIHLYDDDVLYAHNAFRTPGAASIEELSDMPKKVDYLSEKYGLMHRNVIPHPVKITLDNVDELKDMRFVFIAIDGGSAKETIVKTLESFGVPFIDVGLGVYRKDDSLGATLRVTMSMDGHRAHTAGRISFADQDEDEYDWNIQTADLNMLNAAMAVVRWKKYCAYYVDRKQEYHSTYTLTRNQVVNGDYAE